MAGNTTEIYKKFVLHEKDLAGKIAFSEFEKEKIEYLADNPGSTPEDITKYIVTVTQPAQVTRLRGIAEADLQAIFQRTFESELKNIRENQNKELSKLLKENTPTFLSNLGVNLASSVIFAVIVIVCFVLVNISGADILTILGLKPAN